MDGKLMALHRTKFALTAAHTFTSAICIAATIIFWPPQ
jgi:hypothetical protein